jgi:hypothetical protein
MPVPQLRVVRKKPHGANTPGFGVAPPQAGRPIRLGLQEPLNE